MSFLKCFWKNTRSVFLKIVFGITLKIFSYNLFLRNIFRLNLKVIFLGGRKIGFSNALNSLFTLF